jgi:NitT/TauT family transport system permease protein
MHTTLKLYSLAVLLLAWIALSFVFSPDILPGPIPVFAAIIDNLRSGDGFFHLYKTVSRVVLGLVLAMFLGTGIGLMMGLSRKGEIFFESWVMIGLTIPAVVYAIVCLLWFGLNEFAAIIAIGVTAFPSVAINMWQGVKDIDMQLVAMGKAFQLPTYDVVRKIVLPQTVPYVLAATRYALGISWKIATTVELIGMSSGVGYMLHYWFGLFSMTQVLAWTLTFIIVLLFIEYVLINPFEKRSTAWRPVVQV